MKQLVLESGRRVSLAQLHQEPTYAGVLAGKPAQHLNEIIIEDIVDGARQYSVAEPVLISPSSDALSNRLPGIACVAVLASGELNGGSEPYSAMTFVWFQEELAVPFPPEVEATIRAVDWEAAAAEWCP